MPFYTDPQRLNLPNILCLQIYQSLDIDDGADSTPVVVVVPIGAKKYEGPKFDESYVDAYDIYWETVEEPELIPEEPSGMNSKMFGSKLGGAIPRPTYEAFLGKKILGQIGEDIPGINFGRMRLVLYTDESGNICCKFD